MTTLNSERENDFPCFLAASCLNLVSYDSAKSQLHFAGTFQTGKLFDGLCETRWTSFDRSNRKIFLLTLMAVQEPKKLSFTDTVSCNYELGVQVNSN